jgi:hypothetical protein
MARTRVRFAISEHFTVPTRSRLLTQTLAFSILITLLFAAVFRLSRFPGLHGDEAWAGLRAIEIMQNGFFSVHGMVHYIGAAFTGLVAVTFSALGATVFSLRLPGALLNWAAIALVMSTFWSRGSVPLYLGLLFASSLLFLFYSRVAWEVCAFENFTLVLIIFALSRLLSTDRPRFRHAFLFFFAFAFGTYNHFIFLAAALSFTIAALFISFRDQSAGGTRIFLLNALNLLVQAVIYYGKPRIADGDFLNHAMPALLSGGALLLGATFLFVIIDRRFSPLVVQFLAAKPFSQSRLGSLLMYFVFAGLIYAFREHLSSFFGTLSGVIMRERVVSDETELVDSVAGLFWAAVLLGLFLLFLIRATCSHGARQPDALTSVLLVWPAAFLAIFHFVTPHTAERYYLIPHFLFLVALALVLNEIHFFWKKALGVVLIIGFIQSQFFFWSEVTKTENRRPMEFRFGHYYRDTSAHFLKLDQLATFLREKGICKTESSSFFINEPLQFMQKTHPPFCRESAVARIEYCDTCREPVPWFAISHR